MLRSATEWQKIFDDMDVGLTTMASRVLDDLTGYPINTQHRHADIEQLASALLGYHRYIQQEGEKLD